MKKTYFIPIVNCGTCAGGAPECWDETKFETEEDSIKILAAGIDTTKVIGYKAVHKFRCKTKGGNSTIATYTYIIDKKCKNIILKTDDDSELDSDAKRIITDAISGDSVNSNLQD